MFSDMRLEVSLFEEVSSTMRSKIWLRLLLFCNSYYEHVVSQPKPESSY